MEMILGVLWLAGVFWAGKHAIKHAAAEFRKARGTHAAKAAASGTPSRPRRTAVAWWVREVRHGFPVTRTGFHAGWLAHQTAMDQHRAKREASKTSHLEARASIASGLAEHRRRQKAAQDRIDAAGQPLLDEVAARRAAAKERLRAARKALEENGDAERAAGINYETEQYLDLNDDVIDAEKAVKDARSLPSRRVDGKPETPADTRFFNERESGYTGPLDADGNRPDPSDPQVASMLATLDALHSQPEGSEDMTTRYSRAPDRPAGARDALGEAGASLFSKNGGDPGWRSMTDDTPSRPAPSSTGGSVATATETSYTTVATAAKNQADQADTVAADITRLRAEAERIAEDMEAVNLSGGTLSDQMDHVARLRAAEQALNAVTESGGQVVSTLSREHGGVKEAVDDAPAEPAEMGFYKE